MNSVTIPNPPNDAYYMEYVFPPVATVCEYDILPTYRTLPYPIPSAVDILASYSHELWFIEIKDFRRRAGSEMNKGRRLDEALIKKFSDTEHHMYAVVPAYLHVPLLSMTWRRYVFHVETVPDRLNPNISFLANLRLKIQHRYPNVIVGDSVHISRVGVPWKIRLFP